ncbi:MAG: DegV family EDD domain-containing protein [Lachnospiraceae bacterium]|nr:DegV family EDD domain-containing protein [Lachnospiraceae bacterium]
MSIFRRIKAMITDPERDFRERVFVVLTISGIVMGAVALLGDLIYGENILEIIILIGTVLITPITTYFGVRYRRVELAIRVISIGVAFVVMPIIFFAGGGAEGGAIPWFIFAYLYMGLVLTGWWRVCMISSFTVGVVTMFALGYQYPGLIQPHDRGHFYLDIALGVVEVGLVCVIMTWFQNLLFTQENKRAQEETRKVEDLNRSQNRFFSSMSHELRTPINSILGLNEIIIRQEDASEEILRDASNIQGAGRMLLALVNDILDFSKIEAGKMDIVPVNYSVAELVSEIVNMIWLRAEQKGLEFKVEVDPSIPAELFGDEVRIKQILVNLLNNAVKYTKEGSVTLHIEKEEIKGDQILLMISVIDTGMGIKQDDIPYLFNAFQRVDEENNARIEGTGLGLSIVKQLVDMMDGKVSVNSVYSQGSTFVVTLWQRIARFDSVGEINITGTVGMNKGNRYQVSFTAPDARILIVDDNEMNLEVEKKLLIGTEISVDTALSGEEALSRTAALRYDLILMDHLMPEMDGITCMQQIRKQVEGYNNHVPIIVLTANAGSENRELYSNSGFDGYLVKPVSGHQLEEAVLSHLPAAKVNRADSLEKTKLQLNASGSYSRKIPVSVTSSTACDLPAAILEDLQIDVLPFNIGVDGRTYRDAIEAGTEELIRYAEAGMQMSVYPPTQEQLEKFFGQELKKAHNLIYITVSGAMGEEYRRATAAARAYGNVWVYDSEGSSASVGWLVLAAYRMSTQGKSPEAIIAELDRIKAGFRCSFVTDGSYFRQRRATADAGKYNLIRLLSIRPIIGLKNGRYRIRRFVFGEQEQCFEKFIDQAFPLFANPDPDLILVVYVDLTEQEREMIRNRILRHVTFRNIAFLKASGAFALNCGPGSLGLVYVDRSETPSRLSTLLGSEISDDSAEKSGEGTEGSDGNAAVMPAAAAEQAEPADSGDRQKTAGTDVRERTEAAEDDREKDARNAEEAGALSPAEEKKWYDGIPGINVEQGIQFSGSEESYFEILKMFYEAIGEKSDEIERLYAGEDWENYTIKVHALKSSARIVGAEDLADAALGLEKAGKEGDLSYIREHHAGVMKDYLGYAELWRPVFEQADPAAEGARGIS